MIFQSYIRKTKNLAGKTVFNGRLRFKEPEWKKWKELVRTVNSRSEANTKLTNLEVEIRQRGATRLEAGKVTFRQLATYCKENKYTPATYDADGTKLTDVRSVQAAHIALAILSNTLATETL